MILNTIILLLPWLFICCLCEITKDLKSKLLSDFINYYNLQPSHDHSASDGYLQSVRAIDSSIFRIEVSFSADKDDKRQLKKCSATVKNLGDQGIALVNNDIYCSDIQMLPGEGEITVDSVEDVTKVPIEVEHQLEQTTTSDEQGGTRAKVYNSVKILTSESTRRSKDHVKTVPNLRYSDNSLPLTGLKEQNKKKVIDEMLEFLKYSGFKARPKQNTENIIPRVKRSYDYDLQILSLSEDFRDLKESIENAKYVYEMAQTMVDYLNEVDLEVKNRVVKHVVKAEEEEENDKRFTYIQAQIIIPCSMADCDVKRQQEKETKICNGVIDSTNKNNPQILTTFCYIDNKGMDMKNNVKEVPLDNPVLLRLTKEVLRAMEMESTDVHAIKMKKLVSANTRAVSGRVTKITMVVERVNCNKSIPLVLRTNCSTLENLGANVCEVIVHEKHWLKEKKISYICTERPIDMTITSSKLKQYTNNMTVNDPKITEIIEEALQYLETQSDKKYKQVLININKITTQIIAGFLIDIDFIVGYTNCSQTEDLRSESSRCELLSNEPLRTCKAQIWDRSWIVDGRQMEVYCDENMNKSKSHGITGKNEEIYLYKEVQKNKPRIKRGNEFGGIVDQDPTEPKYTQLADESLHKYISDTGNPRPHKLIRVDKVTTQVVSGLITRIDFVATPTDESGGDDLTCHSEVWEQSWNDKKNMTVNCQNEHQKVKRDAIVGGLTAQDPADPKYFQLADESLKKYLSNTGNPNSHKVLKVDEVTTQVVSGFITRLDFVATSVDGSSGDDLTCHSEVWEQSWLDRKDITVNCQSGRRKVKRDKLLPGGLEEKDASDPKYFQLADESLKKYLSNTGNPNSHKVARVDKVTYQVVAGSMTRLDFVATPTDGSSGDDMTCHSEVWEQSWLDRKEITVNCQNGRRKVKRDAIAGGLIQQDPADPKYFQLADESLKKYLSNTGNPNSHKVLKVDEVTTQVVSGFITRLDFVATSVDGSSGDDLTCHSEVLEQSWLDRKDITVNCQNGQRKVKRDAIAGGLTQQDPADPKYFQLADESLKKYLSNTGNPNSHKVLKVDEVTTQVVSGFITRLDFVATSVDGSSGDDLTCHSEVWEQSWLDRKDITVNCQSRRRKVKRDKLLPGGLEDKDASDPKYFQLADESLTKYLSNTGNPNSHKVARVDKVTYQVVSGFITRLDFVATSVDESSGDDLTCHSEVWEQSWLDRKDITVNCQNGQRKVKRDAIAGGLIQQDPADPKYFQLADESLKKYLSNTGNPNSHKVLKVDEVTTQVVSGFITRLDFVATSVDGSSGDDLTCHSEVLEQSWLDRKDITVNCQTGQRKVKRDAIAGGLTQQDPADPKYFQLADESLKKYLSNTGNPNSHKVLKVDEVTTQVVSGFITRLDFVATSVDGSSGDDLTCHSEVWEQSWLDRKDITVNCQSRRRKVKRDKLLPGGLEDKDASDPKYFQLANESLTKYLSNTGNPNSHKVARVDKVTYQVVSGFITRLDFVATSVDESSGDDLTCHSEVWEQSWLDRKDITVNCQNGQRKVKRDAIAGGLIQQDPADPKYFQLADESLKKYLSNTGNPNSHKVLKVDEVTTQVVSGFITRLDFVATLVDGSSGDDLTCHSEVLEQSWLDRKDITVNCQNGQRKVKRDAIAGGLTQQDPADPKYFQLADESLKKYLSSTGNPNSHKVLKVDEVTTQVVSGFITRLDFVATSVDGSSGDDLNCHSEVLEQSWLDRKDITVNCQTGQRKVKRDAIAGGLTQQDPADPKYFQLADESLKKYLSNTGNPNSHKVLKVVEVTTQVVSGFITRLDFVATSVDGSSGDDLTCHSEVWEQSWLDRKDITVNCQSGRRKVKRDKLLPGGLEEKDASDPKYFQLADESLKKYLSNTGNPNSHKVARVDKVTYQVVAGSMTRLDFVATPTDGSSGEDLTCHSEVWEQSWIDRKDITVNCQSRRRKVKRDKLLPGGLEEKDASDPKYFQLADESLKKYLSNTGNPNSHKVARVDKVTYQVVAGSMTRLDFVATSVDGSSGDDLTCHSEVLEQSWLDRKDITVNCQSGQRKVKRDAIVGGLTQQDPADPKYFQLADESLKKYLSNTGNPNSHKVLKVDEVTTQVVSGFITRLDFVATSVDGSSGDDLTCHSEVWEQSWLDRKDITVNCQSGRQKVKRDKLLPGGLEEKDASDPKYFQLADESLKEYLSNTGNPNSHKVARVDKVTYQVVAGSMTRLDFVATSVDGSSGDDLTCHSEVLEQSWLDRKDITVNCQNGQRKVKRDAIAGGLIQQDPADPKYFQLADESLKKYLSNTGNPNSHKVLKVDEVTTQVVSGFITRLDFVATLVDGSSGDDLTCHSEVLEQSWLDRKDITVNCQNGQRKVKRDAIAGGLTQQDPADPKYFQLADESLKKYLSNTGNPNSHKVLKVVEVTTQVVSGFITRLDFVATSVDGSSGDDLNCHSEVLEQSWLDRKDITVNCQTGQRKVKRDAIAGGLTQQDPADPKYFQLADESLKKYLSNTGNPNSHKVLKVVEVTTQVVSGFITRLDFVATSVDGSSGDDLTCHSEVWEQSWLDRKDITVNCQSGRRKVKRDKLLPGGLEEKDASDPKYFQLADESLKKYLSNTGNPNSHKVARVDKVTYQVVAGSMTRLDFVATPTDGSSGEDLTCHSEVWEQSWIDRKDITVNCQSRRRKVKRDKLLPGGLEEKDASDPKYFQLADESLKKYLSNTGNPNSHKVARVDKVTYQVVAGSMTRLDFVATSVDGSSGDDLTCHSEVLEQSWLDRKDITVNCQSGQRKVKRDAIVGGLTQQDPADPKYFQLADESLKKYLSNTGNPNSHKVLKVDEVTTQVVSGFITRLDFVATSVDGSSGDDLTCHSEVWEQSWLDRKDITVNCQSGRQKVKRDKLLPGGLEEKDASDPKYFQLADESLKEYLSNTGNPNSHKVARVDKVTYQVVAGSMTRLDFVATSVDGSSGDDLTCHSEVLEQSWLDRKDITVNCQSGQRKVKRDAIVGGLTQQDPADPKYFQLADESLKKYLSNTGNPNSHKVLKVVEVTTQVVSGFITRLDFVATSVDGSSGDDLTCHSEVWEQSWLDRKDITVNCQSGRRKVKRDKLLPGGLEEKDASDPKYFQLADESLKKYLSNTGNPNSHKVARVDKVTYQVVAGSMTRLDFVATPTDGSSGEDLTCHSEVWEQSWIDRKDITVNCQSRRRKVKRDKLLPGGLEEKDASDPKYFQLADESLKKYLSNTGNPNSHKVARVDKVTYQVVSGFITRLDFVATSVDGSNGDDDLTCHSEVWEQSWLDKKDFTVNCQSGQRKVKRDAIAGGLTQQDPADPKYFQLADESLKKYLSNTGNPNSHKVLTVDEVTTQVVSGFITRLDFVATSVDGSSGDDLTCHSEVWEQSWLDRKDITVNCQSGRRKVKRDKLLPGGLEEKDASDPKYFQLADESLKKYLSNTGNPNSHKVARVDKVTYQVVAGSMTRLDFIATPTDGSSGDDMTCHSEVWEQPWIDGKNITVNCQSGQRKVKRDAIAGGLTQQDPADPKYFQLADESLKKYLSNTGNPNSHKVLKVDEVTTQVVAGSMTRLDFVATSVDGTSGDDLTCHSEVWEQSWLDRKDFTVNCQSGQRKVKRDAIAGGLTQQDPADPKYFQLADESLKKYLSNTGNPNSHKVLKVDEVTTQVVSGFITRLDFVATPTDGSSGDDLTCHSEVWEQSWLDRKDITVNCQSGRRKVKRDKLLPGGLEEKDASDPKYFQLADESLKKYLSNTGNPNSHKVARVDKVTYQVVAGSMTRLDFVATSVDGSSGDDLICHSEVLEQSWLDRKDITVNCQSGQRKVKRDAIVGGLTQQDPADPKYFQLADESLKKYLSNTGNPNSHKVLKVDEVTTQVVSGFITRLDFVATLVDGSSGDDLTCHSEVLEQSWLDRKDITVNCQNGQRKVKRDAIAGGLTQQDPADPKYFQLADESLKKYLSSTGNPNSHKVLKVDEVTTQVVSGFITRLDFVATSVDGSSGDDLNCHSEVLEQSWLDRKDITVNCQTGQRKVKRDAIAGGLTQQDPADPKYFQLADESLKKYLSNTGNPNSHKVLTVDEVTTQVVSGFITRLDFVATSVDGSSGDDLTCHSEVWEQSWLDRKDITVNCQSGRRKVKRDKLLPGGLEEKDASDPKYFQLADESLKKYLSNTGNPNSHKVARVDKVTYQVVAGSMTRLDFIATPTDGSSGDDMTCHSEVWEQPWIDGKNITVNCQSGQRKVKRDAIAGGLTQQDPADPKYFQLADESLKKYLSNTGNPNSHKVLKVDEVTTQVVAGSMTRLDFVATSVDGTSGDDLTCHSEVWEQSWLDRKDITVNCQSGPRKIKRDAKAGGLTQEDPADPKYFQLADESLKKYLSNTGNPNSHKVLKVDEVTTQVVAGSMTRLDFVATPTDGSSGDDLTCHSEVWEQSWLDRKDITVNCQSGRRKVKRDKLLPGGLEEKDASDPKYFQLADESLKKYLSNTGNPNSHKVARVDKVTYQVVAGSMTRLDFVATSVDGSSGDDLTCHSEVLEQSWLDRKDITVNCQSGQRKVKRDAIVGGLTQQDPADPKYFQLADESLKKYLSNTGNPNSHKVLKVDEVTTQVVSGFITRLDFVATPTDGSSGDDLTCHSEVWEQSWLDRKDITVNCQSGRRKVKRDKLLPGGLEEKDASDPKYFQLADESLKKYLSNTGNPNSHKVARVDKVTYQVVAGSMTRLDFVATSVDGSSGDDLTCHSEVLEQSWLDRKDITVNCQSGQRKVKRDAIVGGLTQQDPADPKYFQLADESLKKYLSNTGNPNSHKVLKVDEVTTQVVSGFITRLDFVATPTDGSSGDDLTCHSEVWEQSWLDRKDITVNCQSGRRKVKRDKLLPGGLEEKDASDPKYFQLADESLKKYLSNTGNPNSHKVARVDKVTYQVVAGSMTRLDFVATSVDGSSGDDLTCHSEVLEQSWLDRKDITVNCQSGQRKVKRDAIVGGLTQQDPADPKYFQLADESLKKYLSNTGNPNSHKVLTVDEVTTQVVSGFITRLDFVATSVDGSSGDDLTCHSEVWEQSWLDRKDITVNCQSGRRKVKRDKLLPGGLEEKDASDPKYFQLADESLKKYLSNTGNPNSHKVARVDKVTYQVVAGSMTRLDFIATPTDGSSGDDMTCHSEVWEQPWIDGKNITVNCQSGQRKVKRDAIAGGLTQQDPADPKYFQLADESLKKYLSNTGNPNSHKVLKVDEVTTQVVAGSMTRLDFVATSVDGTSGDDLTCHSEVWEQSWLDRKDITVNCQSGPRKIKRDAKAGGLTQEDPADPKYFQLADESLKKYLSNTGNPNSHKVLKVDEVTTQVVSGFITRLDFVATPTDGSSGDDLTCHSEVWEQSWLDRKDITVNCQSGRRKVKRDKLLPGGLEEKDASDPKYFQLADESLKKYLSNTGNPNSHKVARVDKVTYQVVAGSMTRLDFVATPTDGSSGDDMTCHSEVWEQPWIDGKNITVNCQSGQRKVKRDAIAGGLTQQDPADPKYFQLADESLKKYLSNTGNPNSHKVLKVDEVTTQVVAGSMTRLDFVATPTDGSSGDDLTCHSEVLEQSWLDRKDITVNCQSGRRKVKRDKLLPGGLEEKDASDPKYFQLADESLKKYLSNTGNPNSRKVARVDKVTYQVVSGFITRLDFLATSVDGSSGDDLTCHSEVWEQPWIDRKDITVNCQSGQRKVKRDAIAGGLTQQDPADPKYFQLADESLKKYLSNTGNPNSHKVLKVDKVTTQVVSGFITRLDFVATSVDGSSGDDLSCNSEVWEQSWLDRKDITVNCQSRRRKVKRDKLLPGGLEDKDASDPKYFQLADESLKKYLSNTGNPNSHKVARVDKVTYQLVAGSMTRLNFVATPTDGSIGDDLICHSAVLEQSWVNIKNFTVNCQNGHQKVKRDTLLDSSLEDKDASDPKYFQLADESLQKYLAAANDSLNFKVVRVENVNIQHIRIGLQIRLNFVALPNDPTKSDILKCFSEIVYQSQLDKKDFKVSCQYVNHAEKKIVADIIKQNPDDNKYFKLASESLAKYLLDTGIQKLYRVVRLDEVTTEMDGLTRITFVISSTDNVTMHCFSEIMPKSWPDKNKLHVICESDLDLNQKQAFKQENTNDKKNEENEQDITKPEYQLMAAQALRQFSKEKQILHKVVEITHVTKRYMSRVIYKIDFTAAPTDCSFNISYAHAHSCKLIPNTNIYCRAEIYEKSGLSKKKIGVECFAENDYDDVLEQKVEGSRKKNSTLESQIALKQQDEKVFALAEEALEEFVSSSNKKNVFRMIEIHYYNDYLAEGLVHKLEFSIAPTTCLIDSFVDLSNNCEFKQPLEEYYCKAKIQEQAWLDVEKDITVHCNHDKESIRGKRSKRQTDINFEDDNEINEDITYYYADRAVQSLNERSDTNNLYKLITIHAARKTVEEKSSVIKMYIEVAETYCLRQHKDFNTINCEEMEGLNHRLCLSKIYPSPDDELVVRQVTIVCDEDDTQFNFATGLYVPELIRLSLLELERLPEHPNKLVHQGEPQVIPSLDSMTPVQLNFIVARTNCSRDVDLTKNPFQCYLETTVPSQSCNSNIWLDTTTRTILNIEATCNPGTRKKRSVLDNTNGTINEAELDKLMLATLEKLEMASLHRYKQRVLHINSYSSKITSGKVTTIDFDVAYTSCLKYEWVDNITSCDFLEHLPRRHCVAQIWERLWINNGMNIDVSCEDDETPLEAHVEFESAEMANQLAQESLKHIEAKYPSPMKQKVVRIFSLEKQVVAGVHYRMKMEVGYTDCVALSDQTECKPNTKATNKFCRVNVWLRPWTDHPPNFRVNCDYQDGTTTDLYHQIQAEHLFYNFLATYSPSYINDHQEIERRFAIFKTNVKKIHEYNVHEKGTAKYGVTRFADLSYGEFSSRYLGLKTNLHDNSQPPMEKAQIPNVTMPINFDWREFGAVTEVKDQGECGISWAFSVTGNIESQRRIKYENLDSLSEQQLLDCDHFDNGCKGGLPENAYRAIKDMGGMQSDAEYQYEAEVDKCLFNSSRAKVRISGAVNITTNETDMGRWLVYNGPISVGMNARPLQFYMSGIAYPWKSFCDPDELDHAALIIGFGVRDDPVFHTKIPYWVVKNSWGKEWGEQGYFLMQRGGGTCGINKMATSAIIDN